MSVSNAWLHPQATHPACSATQPGLSLSASALLWTILALTVSTWAVNKPSTCWKPSRKYFPKKVYIISPTNQKTIQNYKIQAKEGHVAPGYFGLLSARIRTLPPPDIGIDHYTRKSHARRRCRSASIACSRAQLLQPSSAVGCNQSMPRSIVFGPSR